LNSNSTCQRHLYARQTIMYPENWTTE
jgi:hypothetical protein